MSGVELLPTHAEMVVEAIEEARHGRGPTARSEFMLAYLERGEDPKALMAAVIKEFEIGHEELAEVLLKAIEYGGTWHVVPVHHVNFWDPIGEQDEVDDDGWWQPAWWAPEEWWVRK